uniref:Translin-associated factor X-interacting protein 1 N-terminal domain-containing protein n=1 Tax=Mastacembelus armatus TaxID=205130 RepID=A0A3Q3NAR4_9TELE
STTVTPVKHQRSTPDILTSGTDERFFQSLFEFIEEEKRYLRCPEQGPDELRYIIYRSVFNKVIARATAYKRLLLSIKAEYDDTIRELKRRQDEARMRQRNLATETDRHRPFTDQGPDVSRFVHADNECLAVCVRTVSAHPTTHLSHGPGLTVAESEDPEALDGHLKRLEAQRAALLDRKSRCVSLEVRAELDAKLHAAELHRDQLTTENNRLKVL